MKNTVNITVRIGFIRVLSKRTQIVHVVISEVVLEKKHFFMRADFG